MKLLLKQLKELMMNKYIIKLFNYKYTIYNKIYRHSKIKERTKYF